MAALASSLTEKEKEEAKKILVPLLANDTETPIYVPLDVAFQAKLIKEMIINLGIELSGSAAIGTIQLDTVDSWTLEKLIEWCTAHRDIEYCPKEEYEDQRVKLTQEDEKWMDVPPAQLLSLINGSSYLNIPGIIDIIAQKIANMANGKTVQQIRVAYGLDNDFEPEEEAEMNERYDWVEKAYSGV